MAKSDKSGGWNNCKTLFVGDVVVLGMTLLAGLGLMSARVKANETGKARASVTVSSSCQLDATTDSAHEKDVAPGTYEHDIGKTTISATCNDANGYAVYAIGYTNTEFGRNDMLGTNTGRTIDTGTATLGTDSSWAMKLTSVAGDVAPTIETDFQSYNEVPDEYTKVASYGNSTANYVAGSQFEATYAAYVSSEQTPDTYVGKVKYTLVHPADTVNAPCTETYTINYNANGGTGSMDSQTACADVPIAILPSGFTPKAPANEHQFGVWNTEADGSGYTFTARQFVTNIASPGETITLYAQWVRYIQDLTPQMCKIVAKEAPITVVDRRDGNDYTVRFLQGACWMTQNLRITGTVYDQYSNFSTNTQVNVCENDLTVGNTYDEARCHDSGNTTNGVWYNYVAASAKTIMGESNATEATEDICPAGWHLPNYGYPSKPAGSIYSLVGMDSEKTVAFNAVAGGFYIGGSLGWTGRGYWWSTTAYSASSRLILYLDSSSLNITSGYRYDGHYIRCVRQ